jgi:hypothetical protein
MSSVVISGDTSGAITLAAPAVAGTNTITLPASAGTVALTSGLPASGQLAKAWVNFVGSSGSVNSSYNVSSVTRNATGQYTVNFTTALGSSTPSIVATINGNTFTFGVSALASALNGTTTTTTAVIYTGYTFGGSGLTANDYTNVGVVAFSS